LTRAHGSPKTQIQLPNEVYRRAKRLAEKREISMAELIRRGLELILSQYPEPDQVRDDWRLPAPRKLSWRDLSHAQIKELAQITETEAALARGNR
jgi:hypothetical protein